MKRLQISSYQVLLLAGTLAIGLGLTPNTLGFTLQPQGEKRAVAAGEKLEIKGVVFRRDGETIVVRDMGRTDTVVLLTDETEIKTTKKGVFRGGKSHSMTTIIQGLILEVDGKGDSEGRLVAKDIRFKEEDLHAAITASVRVNPVEEMAKANKQGIEDTNKRISELDEWDLVKTVTVYFAVGRVALSPEAKATLDEIGPKANTAKNYKVEVAGFADSTGNAQKNLELSQQRADNVVQYLTVKYNVPLRRISTPMGYGATQAAAQNPAEHNKDRRVDIRILVNKAAR